MTTQPLTGKVALVTASSRYTGTVIAATLARAGAKTAIHYHRSRDEAEALAQKLRAEGFKTMGKMPLEITLVNEKEEIIDQIEKRSTGQIQIDGV